MTTRCENLIQHTRTPAVAVSHMRNIRDLIATILSQVSLSYALLILSTVTLRCFSSHSRQGGECGNAVMCRGWTGGCAIYESYQADGEEAIHTSSEPPKDIHLQHTAPHSSRPPHLPSRFQSSLAESLIPLDTMLLSDLTRRLAMQKSQQGTLIPICVSQFGLHSV